MINIEKSAKGKTLYFVAVDLLLISDDKILLQRRANTGWNDGKWNLVGGHIEDEETWEQALAREAKEELGIIINPADIKLVHCIQHRTNRLTMQFYATCTKYKGTPTIQPEIEHGTELFKADALEWFDMNNLPSEIIPSAKQAIKQYKENKHFSQAGFN